VKNFLFLFLTTLLYSYGYNQVLVKGKIVDDLNRPLSGAQIKATGVKEKFYSNSKGEFSIPLSENNSYTLKFTSINHYSTKKSINLGRRTLELGIVELKLKPADIVIVETQIFDGPIEKIKPPAIVTIPS
jgi:hypothetical protein